MVLVLLFCTTLFADYLFDHEIGYVLGDRVFTETDPPLGPVRPVAEFEPASHVLIRYPLGIPIALVAHLSNTAHVITLVSSSSVQNQATNAFNSGGVNMSNVSFMIANTDSYWTRDFGPWFIVDGNNQFGVVDFRYNRPRPNDDAIPSIFAPAFGFNYYGMNLYQTGGNYMTDGIDTAAQTQIAYTENTSLTHLQVNQKMQSYLGISNHYVINDPNNTYIDHIDCWGKFLAPDKVLIRSVPTTHSQYAEIEAVASFFANTTSAWGYPYRVYRVYTPQNQPYTNSLILNKKVFVPIMNNTNDAAALQVYRTALPGYEVIGILGTSSAPWESTDALHCRTHEVADKEMLYIKHTPYRGMYDLADGYSFSTKIIAHSNTDLYSDSLFVSYKINQGQWQRSSLVELGNDTFTTILTNVVMGDTIRYFIHAADFSGRSSDHPYTAALDPHIFSIVPDTAPPVILHDPIVSITNQENPVVFTAIVSDNQSVLAVGFEYRIDDSDIIAQSMSYTENDTWTYDFVTAFNADQQFFSYRIVAVDTANPLNYSYYPAEDIWITVPITTLSNQDSNQLIVPVSLKNIYPNPYNSKGSRNLNIDFSSPAGVDVSINIYNVRGQNIRTITTTSKADGTNRIHWNGKDNSGAFATRGMYIVQLKSAKHTETKKFVITE